MIGCFRYLNAYPYRRLLEWGGMPYRLFDDPKALALAWERGEVLAALLPLRYVQRGHDRLPWGIGSAGAVRSVLLLSDYPISSWEALVLDAASTSSVALIKWLMKEGHLPRLPILDASDSARVGRLFIGDAALRWKIFYPYRIDLGALVYEKVKIPFVYAVWCAKGALRHKLNRLFRRPWDWWAWAEEASWEYHLPATEIFAYWQGIRYRLGRKAVHFWHRRLPPLS